jgi:hypothetical protein
VKKSLCFVLENGEAISVYLGNRFLVISGCFKKKDSDDCYIILDVYDLSDPEFWKAEFKANSNEKTVLCGGEGYGTHIKCDVVDSIESIGMWRDGKGEECNNCS